MADIGASNWSETDASNNTTSPDGAPEGMAPSGVNDTIRANMGATKRFWDRVNGVKTTGGTTTAYTLSYDVAANAYYDGEVFTFVVNATCGATPTLNINSLGAKNLRVWDGTAWGNAASGDLVANQVVIARYNSGSTAFDVINGQPATIAAAHTFSGATTFSGTVTMSGKALNEAEGTAIASATTTDIGAATGNTVHITGTTTITGLGTVQAGTRRTVIFDGALTLTHNASSLVLPGAANITTVSGDIAVFVSEGSGNWRCVSYQRVSYTPGGGQIVTTADATMATGTTATPLDDTIPQNTEGDQYLSLSITPKSATSTLYIDVEISVASSALDNPVVALFQDSTANALASRIAQVSAANASDIVTLSHSMTSGTTSATTFKVRVGTTSASTITVNGFGGARKLGGTMFSRMKIEERI